MTAESLKKCLRRSSDRPGAAAKYGPVPSGPISSWRLAAAAEPFQPLNAADVAVNQYGLREGLLLDMLGLVEPLDS